MTDVVAVCNCVLVDSTHLHQVGQTLLETGIIKYTLNLLQLLRQPDGVQAVKTHNNT